MENLILPYGARMTLRKINSLIIYEKERDFKLFAEAFKKFESTAKKLASKNEINKALVTLEKEVRSISAGLIDKMEPGLKEAILTRSDEERDHFMDGWFLGNRTYRLKFAQGKRGATENLKDYYEVLKLFANKKNQHLSFKDICRNYYKKIDEHEKSIEQFYKRCLKFLTEKGYISSDKILRSAQDFYNEFLKK